MFLDTWPATGTEYVRTTKTGINMGIYCEDSFLCLHGSLTYIEITVNALSSAHVYNHEHLLATRPTIPLLNPRCMELCVICPFNIWGVYEFISAWWWLYYSALLAYVSWSPGWVWIFVLELAIFVKSSFVCGRISLIPWFRQKISLCENWKRTETWIRETERRWGILLFHCDIKAKMRNKVKTKRDLSIDEKNTHNFKSVFRI